MHAVRYKDARPARPALEDDIALLRRLQDTPQFPFVEDASIVPTVKIGVCPRQMLKGAFAMRRFVTSQRQNALIAAR